MMRESTSRSIRDWPSHDDPDSVEAIKVCPSEPSGSVVDLILEAGDSLPGLAELVDALEEMPRSWSARLVALLSNRQVKTASEQEAAQISSLAFRLLEIAESLDDWPSRSGCLDAMACLCAFCLNPSTVRSLSKYVIHHLQTLTTTNHATNSRRNWQRHVRPRCALLTT